MKRAFTLLELLVSMSLLAVLTLVLLQISGGVLSTTQRVNQKVNRDTQVRIAFDQMGRDMAQTRVGFAQTQMCGTRGSLRAIGTPSGGTQTPGRIDLVTSMSRLSKDLVSELQQVTYQTLNRDELKTVLEQIDPDETKLKTAYREVRRTTHNDVIFLVRTVVEPTMENYKELVWNPMSKDWWSNASYVRWQKTTYPRVTILLKGLVHNDNPTYPSLFNFVDKDGNLFTADFVTTTQATTPAGIVASFGLISEEAINRPFETIHPSDVGGSYALRVTIPPAFDPATAVAP